MPKRARGDSAMGVIAKLVDHVIAKDAETKALRAPIATAAAGFAHREIRAKYAAYSARIDALETQNAALRLSARVAEERSAAAADENNDLHAKIAEQARAIDEKDAEARATEDTLHDMYAAQKLDREEIRKLDSENAELKKELSKKAGDIANLEFKVREMGRPASWIVMDKMNQLKTEHLMAMDKIQAIERYCNAFVFAYTGMLINPSKFNLVVNSSIPGKKVLLQSITDTVDGDMHFCKIKLLTPHKTRFYY
jgi:predicted RNase H-like nuclease (RuvC/YqgF family)